MSSFWNALAGALDSVTLTQPERLIFLLPLIVLAVAAAVRTRPNALAWPALDEARAAGAKRFDRVRGSAIGLRAVALVSLAFVFADPVRVYHAPPEPGFGLDLVLVVDASGSMRSVDTRIGAERRSRLDLARRVIDRFARNRASDGDRVALILFGEAAFTACPLTTDGALLASALGRVEAGVVGEATALGDALALAVKRATAGSTSAGADSALAGRVIVLLTDGRSNSGMIPVEIATELARGEGIRVHTVGIGSTGRETGSPVRKVAVRRAEDADSGELDFERHDVDAETLRRVASATGGRYFPARNSGQLASVYRDIDALERVARKLPPRIRQAPYPEPLLAVAGFCLLLEIGSARVWRRRIP